LRRRGSLTLEACLVRVAIAVQNDFVSPRLDQAPRLVVIDSNDAAQNHLEEVDITGWPAHGRASRLAVMGVDTMICGGVSSFDEAGFDATAVRLINGVSGPIIAVIDAVRQGTIADGQSYWTCELWKEPL